MSTSLSASNQALDKPIVVPLSERGPASTSVVVGFGFWLFLLSDIVIFAALFAAYAVLSDETADGPVRSTLFDKGHVLLETVCLLTSSFTCGLGALAVKRRAQVPTYAWMAATFMLGIIFIGLEGSEFASMVTTGNGPSRSAFLSSFFALVGAHGLHVSIGLFWLVVMMFQITTLGFEPMVRRRLFCFALFWHALDIVWVGVITIVYLGAH